MGLEREAACRNPAGSFGTPPYLSLVLSKK